MPGISHPIQKIEWSVSDSITSSTVEMSAPIGNAMMSLDFIVFKGPTTPSLPE
jgi:hypothetical protein